VVFNVRYAYPGGTREYIWGGKQKQKKNYYFVTKNWIARVRFRVSYRWPGRKHIRVGSAISLSLHPLPYFKCRLYSKKCGGTKLKLHLRKRKQKKLNTAVLDCDIIVLKEIEVRPENGSSMLLRHVDIQLQQDVTSQTTTMLQALLLLLLLLRRVSLFLQQGTKTLERKL
jgi:hypothetical protein